MYGTRNARLTTHDLNRQQRQRSGSQTNLTELGDRRQTYGGLRRSTSNTNLRTPLRSSRATRSPGNRTPTTATGPPSNYDHNRKHAAENAAKVMELIQSSRSFSHRLNLGNGGLKAMTQNQFNDIMSFLMMKIAGKNLISKTHLNNNEDVIVTFLETLKYPYAINKNCLKTPSAHNSFPDAIALLAFVCDVVHDVKKYGVPTDMPLQHCDRLLNDAFTEIFSAEALRNYLLYSEHSEQDDLLDEATAEKLVNGLIAIKMKNKNMTADELAARAEKLRESSEELQQKLVETDCDKYFANIQEKYAEREVELEKLTNDLITKRKCLKMVTLVYDEKAKKLATYQTKNQELAREIQNQKYSVIDIKQLIAKETSTKSSIAMIQNEKDSIVAEEAEAQVKLARLQKLKIDKIKDFNDFTYRVSKKLIEHPSFVKLDVNNLTIFDVNGSIESIQKMCSRLSKLKEVCATIKVDRLKEIEQNKNKVKQLRVEHGQLTAQYGKEMEKFKEAKQNLDDLTLMYSALQNDTEVNAAKKKKEIAEHLSNKQKMDAEIIVLRKEAEELAVKNVELFEDGERRAREIIHAKKMACRRMDEMSKYLDEWADQL